MKRIFLSLLFVVTLFTTLSSCSSKCKHDYSDPTCLNPSICQKCGEIDGEALGHTVVIDHAVSATCTQTGLTEGSHCSACNEVLKSQRKTTALNHTGGTATCTERAVCERCNEVYGETTLHNYKEQVVSDEYLCTSTTCTKAATYYYSCICGEKAKVTFEHGNALGHTYGEWEIENLASVSNSGTMVRRCSTCGKSDNKSYRLDSFIKDKKFIFTVDEFRNMFFDNFEARSSKFGGAQIKTQDGQVMIAIRDNMYNNVGNIGFVVNKNSWNMASNKTDSGFDGMIMILSAKEEFIADAMISFVMSCYPSITTYEARIVCSDMLNGTTTHKGIQFSIKITGNYYTITAVVSE